MIEETAVRVEISAARFASQSIFDILRLTVQAMSSQNYGQQSLSATDFPAPERPLTITSSICCSPLSPDRSGFGGR